MATRLVIMSPRPGRIREAHEVDFGRRFLDGTRARAIKSAPDFVAMREAVLDILYQDERQGEDGRGAGG
jgi:taurine transport system ATP-binding protein